MRAFGHADAGEAALGVAVDLGDRGLGVGEERDAERDDARRGARVYHSSYSQSFHARMHAWPSSGSLALKNTRPQNPVIIDGKFTAAQTPLMSMSRTRASTS